MDFSIKKGQPRGGLVTPRDSVDYRILTILAQTLNFTYEYWKEPNRLFGDEKDGTFTGMIGQLQQEQADMTTIIAPTRGRLSVVEYIKYVLLILNS
ncbi:hypothetical protein Pcinc_000377 [Petrolisthes cinctipes]|uniref:Ionotropic glutamate receptor L-glutamate and glycine-binding domain-containing protein n=1 Tax=Petrolisthes cinctipes TaxID=88211 RepID=A0AAE1GKJ1_PETCI|nr:hypothetical protein Pcinc_008904 [Petrolisthes cinctipes]KAK3891906.1 hypothetical protein Pcinc_004212 [Petrolisthes cinctipes]KAK3893551.1 hypothetical protein Pcinc_002616 [Petrolisthes cinctipes]KAK3895993.1 hypothetical protein Pcinc_000377 [Petrolisthes cinctipes]